MPRIYPVIVASPRKLTNRDKMKGKPCGFCKQPGADTLVVIQVSWFRGEDIDAPVHWSCWREHVKENRAVLLTKGD